MSEIDTSEVRRWAHTFSDKTEAIKNLCDALDEARAEQRHMADIHMQILVAFRERAEKAEAAIKRVRAVCEDEHVCRRCPMPSGAMCVTCTVRHVLDDSDD